jgi:hypothetical protein
MEQWFMEVVVKWVMGYAAQYPMFATVMLGIGFLRLCIKPLMTMAQAFVKMTPYDSDDAWLASFEQSKGYKAFVFLLDWLLSIKMPEKPK